jgi:hypothetical protein
VDAERRLRRIARAGKEWKRTMGRKVDMEGEFSFLVRRSCYFFFSGRYNVSSRTACSGIETLL